MDDDACQVKIVGADQHANYMLSITKSYTIGELKKKINEQYMRKLVPYELYYNKVLLTDKTFIHDIYLGNDSFSLTLEYGIDENYTFVLDDGTTRRARMNSQENFISIADFAASMINVPVERVIVLCDNIIPIPYVTPTQYGVTSCCFRVTVIPVSPLPDLYNPDLESTLKRLSAHSDLRLCYYALDCFFDTNEFSLLTDLAIITRDTLSNVNSVIYWPLTSLLVNTVDKMIRLYISEDYLKFPQLSPSPDHFAFLKAIYECINALVSRFLYMQIPIPEDVFQQLIYPMNLLHDLSRRSSPMNNTLYPLNSSGRQPACMELISISLCALDLYCSADTISLYPPRKDIVQALRPLQRVSNPAIYRQMLSCLSGLCREKSCLKSMEDMFPVENVALLIRQHNDVPEIIRSLFLIYSFLMKQSLEANKRDHIVDIATDYLEQHGDDLPLIEAYVLLVVHAYNGESRLSSPVARALEHALRFSAQSLVIRKWATTLLQGYYAELSPDALNYAVQQSQLMFIALKDNPKDAKQVRQILEILSIYCQNAELRETIITINSMSILLTILQRNTSGQSELFIQLAQFFYQIISQSVNCLEYFRDNHALFILEEAAGKVDRIEMVTVCYELIIILLRNCVGCVKLCIVDSMKNFPSFTIDVFQTIEKYNCNLLLIEKGITILSLFPTLVFTDVIQKVKKLTKYLLAAMSSHNLSLISNIIIVLAKMQLDEASYQYLDSHNFLSDIFKFVNEFVDKPLANSSSNLPHLYYRQFADIVFCSLVYIKQHFQSNLVVSSLDVRSLLVWIDSFKGDIDIVTLWLETMQNYLRSNFGSMTEALEVKTVNMLLDLFVIYNESSIPSLHIEFNVLNVLLNFFFRYSKNILKACRLPSFQHALHSLLFLIYDSHCSSLQIAITPSPSSTSKPLACFQITDSTRRFSPTSPSDNTLSYDSTISPPTQIYYVMQKPTNASSHPPNFSDGDLQFLFDKLLLYIIQFFQGIIQIDEQNQFEQMKPFKHLLLQLVVLSKYIFVFVKKTQAVRAVQGNIESILETLYQITIKDVTNLVLRGNEE